MSGIIQDKRFSALHNDPRFAKVSKKNKSVEVDSRFKAVTEDPRFMDKRSKKSDTTRDTDGRPSKKAKISKENAKKSDSNSVSKLLKNDVDKDSSRKPSSKASKSKSTQSSSSEEDESDEEHSSDDEGNIDPRFAAAAMMDYESESAGNPDSEDEDKPAVIGKETISERLERLAKMSRGEYIPTGIETESETESDEDYDSEEYVQAALEDLHGPELIQDPDAPNLVNVEYTEDEGTNRLALVNLDWDNVTSVDILAALESFLPVGESILDVSIYPSDYGEKKMKEESLKGPQNIFNALDEASESVESTSKVGVMLGGVKKSKYNSVQGSYGKGNESETFNKEALRQYELNRFKYYFAVATFSSVRGAVAVYEACDGMEFEATSNVFDMRFVPNDQEIKKSPRDAAAKVPSDYQPPAFFTRALQSSKVELTWDDDAPTRRRALDWERLKVKDEKKKKRKGRTAKEKLMGTRRRSGDSDDDDDDELADLRDYLATESESSSISSISEVEDISSDSDSESDDSDDSNDSEGAKLLKKLRNASKNKRRKQKERKEKKKYANSSSETDDVDLESKDESEEEEQDRVTVASTDEEEEEEGREITISAAEVEFSDSESDTEERTISFSTSAIADIKQLNKKLEEQQKKANESEFEAYLRKRAERKKEKKKARKEKHNQNADTDSESDGLEGDSFFASNIQKKDKRPSNSREDSDGDSSSDSNQQLDEEKRMAQLELMQIGDSDNDSDNGLNFNLKDMINDEKSRTKGKKFKGKDKLKKKDVTSTGPAVDVSDSRFAAVFEHPDFAIDPTSFHFKATAGMREILTEKSHRKKEKKAEEKGKKVDRNTAFTAPKESSVGSAMVVVSNTGRITNVDSSKISKKSTTSSDDVNDIANRLKQKFNK